MARTRAEDQILDHLSGMRDRHAKQVEDYDKTIARQKKIIDRLMKHLEEHCAMPGNCEFARSPATKKSK